jgi:hypothetical protein
MSASIVNDSVDDSILTTLLDVLSRLLLLEDGIALDNDEDDDDDNSDDDDMMDDDNDGSQTTGESGGIYSDSDSDDENEAKPRPKRRKRIATRLPPALLPFLRKQLSGFAPLLDLLLKRATQSHNDVTRAHNLLRCVSLDEFLRRRQATIGVDVSGGCGAQLARQPSALRSLWLALKTNSELGNIHTNSQHSPHHANNIHIAAFALSPPSAMSAGCGLPTHLSTTLDALTPFAASLYRALRVLEHSELVAGVVLPLDDLVRFLCFLFLNVYV